MKFDWANNSSTFYNALGETLYIVAIVVAIAGVLGLLIGLALYATRREGLLANVRGSTVFNAVLNFTINVFRPIPFLIFLTAVGPLTRLLVGKAVGTGAFIVPAAIMASMATSRIVEQNLVAVEPGLIEAARSMGASPLRILFTVVIPEALAPLVLGYTFIFVAIVDMSALAGFVGGGGLGDFALVYGYRQYDWVLVWVAVAVIVILVQFVQFLGNFLARKILRR